MEDKKKVEWFQPGTPVITHFGRGRIVERCKVKNLYDVEPDGTWGESKVEPVFMNGTSLDTPYLLAKIFPVYTEKRNIVEIASIQGYPSWEEAVAETRRGPISKREHFMGLDLETGKLEEFGRNPYGRLCITGISVSEFGLVEFPGWSSEEFSQDLGMYRRRFEQIKKEPLGDDVYNAQIVLMLDREQGKIIDHAYRFYKVKERK